MCGIPSTIIQSITFISQTNLVNMMECVQYIRQRYDEFGK